MDINISYKRDLNHSYILFSGGVIENENYQVQMVLHRLLPGLLPCCVYSLDNQQVWCCENTSTQKLSVYCQIHALGIEELMWIYGNLLKNLQELQEYLIDLNTIYLTPDDLYVDPFTYRVLCCLVPFYEKDIWESLLELSQYLLGFLDQQDGEAVALAYGIFRYLSKGGSSLEALWTMLYGRQAEDPAGSQDVFKNGSGAERQSRRSIEASGWERQGGRSIGESKWERQSRTLNGVEGPEKQSENLNELSAAERQKIEEIDLEMEQQRQRDLDEIFKQKEDFTKRKWRWRWPSWLRLGKREKREESMEDILFCDGDSVDFGREQEMICEKKEKKTLVGKAMGKNTGVWEENMSMQPRCDEGREEYEETEAGTTLLSAACAKVQAMLIHDSGKERFVLEQPIVVIGKMPGAAQLVLREATVSRIHARIICLEDGHYLEDMNSKNGTYVNGELLESQKRVKLESGDKICFADVPYTYLE